MRGEELIGTPWVFGGRHPEIGLDCWGLIVAIRPELPDYAEAPDSRRNARALSRYINEASGSWRRLSQPLEGCVVTLGRRPGLMTHVGLMSRGRLLHSINPTGVVFDRLEDLDKIGLIYREFYEWD